MIQKYCSDCGNLLIEKELINEGIVPYCTQCKQYKFPMYNVAVSVIVVNKENDKILLIQQYQRPSYILVAGYVNRLEPVEHAVIREVKEETGMTITDLHFNRTKFFEPSNTLMCNFTAFVENDRELAVNEEIDSFQWFSRTEARKEVLQKSLAAEFLNTYLDETGRILAACGNDCSVCPRYTEPPFEKTKEQLEHTAKLWEKIGYRDHVVSNEEISCHGCKEENWCRYQVISCTNQKGIANCGACLKYPCDKMKECFEVTKSFIPHSKEVCTDEEYQMLEKAFFEKEQNLTKEKSIVHKSKN